MGLAQNARLPFVTLTETADGSISNPASGDRVLSVDTTDHALRLKDHSGTIVKWYRRVASGTSTIASGSTSVVVAHGLSATPSANDIVVCPTGNSTNAPGHWWVDTLTSTNFTINCAADPGTSGLAFAWRIDQ